MAMQGVLIEYSTMKYANNQFNAMFLRPKK